LLSSVVPLRATYRKEKDLLARKEIAREEIGAWAHYLQSRKEDVERLPETKAQMEKDLD